MMNPSELAHKATRLHLRFMDKPFDRRKAKRWYNVLRAMVRECVKRGPTVKGPLPGEGKWQRAMIKSMRAHNGQRKG